MRWHKHILNLVSSCGQSTYLILFQWLKLSFCGLATPCPSQRSGYHPSNHRDLHTVLQCLGLSSLARGCSAVPSSMRPFAWARLHGPDCMGSCFFSGLQSTRKVSLSQHFSTSVEMLIFLSIFFQRLGVFRRKRICLTLEVPG